MREHQWSSAGCYHIMSRGHNRETIFLADDDRRHFLNLLQRYRDRFRALFDEQSFSSGCAIRQAA